MILVECNPDEYVISAMGFNRRYIKHQQGKGKVIKSLSKGKARIGIIDEDPGKGPTPLTVGYETVEESEETILLSNTKREYFLIVLKPDLETWLLNRARSNNIKPTDYGIPDDPDRLHSMIHVERNSNFRSFVKDIIRIDEEFRIISKDKRKRIANLYTRGTSSFNRYVEYVCGVDRTSVTIE